MFERKRLEALETTGPSIESISTVETATVAFAFTRAVLALIIIGSVLTRGIDSTSSDVLLVTVVFFLVAAIGLVSTSLTLFRYYRKQLVYVERPWATILLDSALAIGVMAVIDAETSPLAWIALVSPVLETAVFFSMLPAAMVWIGLSLAFLALRLSTGFSDEPAIGTLTLAIQQVLAVLLVSGPAALMSDSTQHRMDNLADARKNADQVSDRLRRIAQAASDMSQENSIESVLDSVSKSAVTLGFDHADVVIQDSSGMLASHGSHSTGPFRLPPLEVLTQEFAGTEVLTISTEDDDFGQLLHSHDLSSGHAVQISSTDKANVVLRVWSKRRPSTEQELRALSLLAGHAREIYRAAELLAEAKAHSDQLLHEVRHDGLTGLANRAFVLQTLEERIARATKTVLFFIDLDGFKEINDTLGHRAGDAALIQISERLGQIDRPGTLAGRMGGDEFIVIVSMNAFDTPPGLEAFGRGIDEAISKPMSVEGRTIQLGSSIGMAVLTDGLDADQLISLADHAMYQAKRAGGGLRVSETSSTALTALFGKAS